MATVPSRPQRAPMSKLARIAAALGALGLAAGNVGLSQDGKVPAATRDWVTTALVVVAGLLLPSAIRIPDPAKAQLVSIVGTLVGAGLNLIAQKALSGNATAGTVIAVLTVGAALAVPGVHLWNAPSADRAATVRPGPEGLVR